MMKLASFDIFDTVLVRKCGKPNNVFWLLAERLFPDDPLKQVEFAKWRIDRNSDKRMNKNYTLTDVYSPVEISSFSEYDSNTLINEELRMESLVLTRNELVAQKLSSYREHGCHIAFISDMYLPKNFIENILRREDIMKDGDNLYVSNDLKKRKDDGSLFEYVNKELHHPKVWLHIGDNPYSDVLVPRRMGIKPIFIRTDFTDIEQNWDETSQFLESNYQLSVLAGLQRYIRCYFNDTAEARIAVDYISPAYISYVFHVLRDAKKKGFKRLYFLSRDSYILQRIAEVIPHDGIEYKYLFVSRASLILPFLYHASKEKFNLIFTNDLIEVDKLLNRLGLSRQFLHERGISFNFNKAETEEQREAVLQAVFRDDIYEYWQNKAEKQYRTCTAYLKQEGIIEDIPFALVDVGWLGTTRMMINDLRTQINPELHPCFSYYWSSISGILPSQYGPFDLFIKSIEINQELCWFIEDYFSLCPYPTTIGYMYENQQVKPIFKESDTRKIKAKVDYNVRILLKLATLVATLEISEETLYTWASSATKALREDKYNIDYSPFADICAGEEPLIRKITLKEYLRMVLFTDSFTKNDYISIIMTYGRKRGNKLWRIKTAVLNTKIRIAAILDSLKEGKVFKSK